MNDIIKPILAHRSIRAYTEQPGADDVLDQINSAAQAAPTWVNLQHVSVIAVKDPVRRKEFAQLCGKQPHIAQTPVFLAFCADYYRAHLAGLLHHQPLELAMDDIDHTIVGAHEAGIAVGTAVVAAESLGLGTVVSGDVRLIAALDLPKYVMPVLGLCIGFAAADPGIVPRLPKEAMYFEETYNRDLNKLLCQYDEVYSSYLEKRLWNNRVGNWTQLCADFYRHPYEHDPEVPEMLHGQGFTGDKQ